MQLYQLLQTPFEFRAFYTSDVSVGFAEGGKFFCEGSVDAFRLEAGTVGCWGAGWGGSISEWEMG